MDGKTIRACLTEEAVNRVFNGERIARAEDEKIVSRAS